jgi:hypothetical protein
MTDPGLGVQPPSEPIVIFPMRKSLLLGLDGCGSGRRQRHHDNALGDHRRRHARIACNCSSARRPVAMVQRADT